MIFFMSFLLLLSVSTFFYIRLPKFGKAPSGARLERMQKSPHYKDGKFQNRHFTPTLTEGYSMLGILKDQFFKKLPRRRPVDPIPSIKTNLLQLPADSNVLVWFGHSSYWIQIDGKRLLIDPVFSGNASPIPGTNTAFKGSDIYTADDFPPVDYLLITHDHYDHLDYETITALRGKVKSVICGLGVGAHFEHWGYEASRITEMDWDETLTLDSGFLLHTASTRHFSGRGFIRNNTLWLSYILQTPSQTIYLGGDSGYDTHFAEIGSRFDSIDLAILENGQYNKAWQAIHMLPPEVLQAGKDLKARRILPVHSSKFMLAQHPWDEPLKELTRLNKENPVPLITPVIGALVYLDHPTTASSPWWEQVQ
ncbi:MBL fold metallo-hydrolase [Niabella pedocola]|uniref:MBL fold metallo-hydrolase n=1 Tax=Niabella pedocola TaxID=1752077 RepID=A0ABS8PPB5_9BACT|nr:MBL fold metallo-hydrolase [Niabella pedocola]MCD2422917.1 MBL fold metallo-hydrolase [Niabella pedocola]